MEISIATVIEGAAVAGSAAVIGLILNQKSALVRIETLLTGYDGTNGIAGDVKDLKALRQAQGEAIHILVSRADHHERRTDEHEERLNGIERRSGPSDRRASV